jgi:hypothetical protein
MIILFHPRATRPRNCRLPLAVLALAAVLEGREEYRIIDGNLEDDPTGAIVSTIDNHQVELLGVSCMPGPQMVAAMETSREIRRLRPTSLLFILTLRLMPNTSTMWSAARGKTLCLSLSTRCVESVRSNLSLACATRTPSAFIARTLSGR